ncbi:MAG: hypothetical protein ABEJ56_06845 [Candidatus Nanohaloarchaea archaeon]
MIKERIDLLDFKMTAMWLTVVGVSLSILNSDSSLGLSLLHIAGISISVTIGVNLWNYYKNGKSIIDERKQKILTDAMAWGFMAALIASVLASELISSPKPVDFMNIARFGFWTWIATFSIKSLSHKWGGG